MTKEDFVNKYSRGTETSTIDLRKVMMVDLNLVINQILKEKKEQEFLNGDCE